MVSYIDHYTNFNERALNIELTVMTFFSTVSFTFMAAGASSSLFSFLLLFFFELSVNTVEQMR